MNIVLVVETPLQLLCGYEAIKTNKGNYKLYIRLTNVGRNDSQLLAMSTFLGLKYTVIKAGVDSKISMTVALLKFVFYDLNIKKYDRLYLGSYFSNYQYVLSNFIRKDHLYYLDDGMATLLAGKIIKNEANFFTFFNLSEKKGIYLERHSFEYLQKMQSTADKSYRCYFIGQPFIDKNMIEFEEYIGFIEKSIEEVGDKQLYYIPHRVERADTLEKISNLSDKIEIIETEECVELFFIKSTFKPEMILTCCSTAVYSLSLIFPHSKMVSFMPKDERITSLEHWDEVENLIAQIKKIKVVY